MKILAIVCFVLGLCAAGVGIHCQLNVIPSMESTERLSRSMNMDDPNYRSIRGLHMERSDEKNTYGQIALVAGGLGLLGGIFVGLKKAKLGFIAAVVSLPGLILGLLQATHMFS